MKHPSESCNVDHCARDSKTIACNDGNECKCFCHVPQAYTEARAAYYESKEALPCNSNIKSGDMVCITDSNSRFNGLIGTVTSVTKFDVRVTFASRYNLRDVVLLPPETPRSL